MREQQTDLCDHVCRRFVACANLQPCHLIVREDYVGDECASCGWINLQAGYFGDNGGVHGAMPQAPGDCGVDSSLFLIDHAFVAQRPFQMDVPFDQNLDEDEHRPHRPFHIDRPQAEEPTLSDLPTKGIDRPVVFTQSHRVHVAGEQQRTSAACTLQSCGHVWTIGVVPAGPIKGVLFQLCHLGWLIAIHHQTQVLQVLGHIKLASHFSTGRRRVLRGDTDQILHHLDDLILVTQAHVMGESLQVHRFP